MKKNVSNLCLLGILVSVSFVSCKKSEKLAPNPTNSSSSVSLNSDNSKFIKGKEISFTPASNDAIISMTKRFVNHTDFKEASAMKTTIYDMEDPDVNAGAWLFEAASNYLENSNSIESEDESVNFSIVIEKRNTGELRGTDLVAKFNAFITNLESYRASEGYKPKVIDIRIGIDNSEVLELLANVTIGVTGIGQYAFPTSNVNPADASQIYLTGSVTQAVRQLNTTYLQVANPNGSVTPGGYFLSSVGTYSTFIDHNLNGGFFYYNLVQYLYPASFFQNEHNELKSSVLSYCSSNSIASNRLWSVFVSNAFVLDQNSQTGIVHYIKEIKTADVNVM